MGITTTLIEDGRIFALTITDPWTIADLVKAEETDKALRDASPFAKVHCLIDTTDMHKMPPGAILTGRRTPSMSHPTAGYIAVVGAGGFTRSVAETVFRLARYNRLKFCATYDEGLDYLRSMMSEADIKRIS